MSAGPHPEPPRGDRGPTGPGPRIIQTRDDGIRLGQFLKLANLIDSGSDVKPMLASGAVTVNGEIEARRGRQLVRGDVVALGSTTYQVG